MNLKRAASACFLLCSLAFLLYGLVRPAYNWDVIGYVGAAEAIAARDSVQIHASTYAEIGRVEGTRRYAIADPTDTPYRILMRTSPAAFVETLRLYRVRIAYVGLIFTLSRLGVSPVYATYAISAASTFVGLLFLLAISRKWIPAPYQIILPPIAIAFGLAETAGLSTPDGLAFALLMISAYLFVQDRMLLLLILPLLVAVRSDLILFVCLLSVSLWMRWRSRRALVISSLIVSLLAYYALVWWTGYPGWSEVFTFTFIDRLRASSDAVVGWKEYGTGLLKGGWGALHSPAFLCFIASSAAAVFLALRSRKERDRSGEMPAGMGHLLTLSILFVLIRLIVFPLPDARFFVAPYLLIASVLLALIAERRARLNPGTNA